MYEIHAAYLTIVHLYVKKDIIEVPNEIAIFQCYNDAIKKANIERLFARHPHLKLPKDVQIRTT